MSLDKAKTQLLGTSDTKQSVLARIAQLYVHEIRSDEKFLTLALSELHNSGEIDVIQLVSGVDRNSSDYDFFTILDAFEKVLPTVTADVERVLDCLVCLVKQAGRDSAIVGVYGAFQLYCSLDEDRPRKSIEFILCQDEFDTYGSFLSSSLLAIQPDSAGVAIQTVESLIAHKNETVRSQAYFTLGRLDVDEAQANVLWELLSSSTDIELDKACKASLLRAILNYGDKFPSYWGPIEELFKAYLDSVSPEVQYEISNIVAFQQIVLPESILKLLIKQLEHVSPEHKRIIDNIDHILVKLVGKNLSTLAIELLESILIQGITLPSLDYFSRELLSKYKELLNQLITKWFWSGESSFCNGAADLLNDTTGNDVELCADMSVLDAYKKQIFACHRAVGWLFTRPVVAGSFLLSVYESGSTSAQKDIEQLLYDPLLLSYPGEVKKYFQASIEEKKHVQLCERLLGNLERHHANLEQVRNLKELRAPFENINTYRKNFDRSVQKLRDKGPKPLFEQMCTVQNLLYGNSSIYYINNGSGEELRQEMEMQSFSHSTEMPRLNVLDPENLDYMLRVFRYRKYEK